jgi:cysteine desulfurase/selenocysteine lyase
MNETIKKYNQITKNFWSNDAYTKWMLELGSNYEIEKGIRLKEYFVRGCENQLWIKCTADGNSVTFGADSDALVNKGILHILQETFESCTPAEAKEITMYDFRDIVAPLSAVKKKGIQQMINSVHKQLDAAQKPS